MDDSGGCLGGLILLGLGLTAIYYFIVYVVPLIVGVGAVILLIFVGLGAIIGLFKAIFNFVVSIKETVELNKSIGRFKNMDTAAKYKNITFSTNTIYYEDIAAKSYFFGPCFKDILRIIKGAFVLNYENLPDFSRGEHWYTRILWILRSLIEVIVTYVLGTVFTLVCSIVLFLLFLVFEVIFLIISGVALFFENLFYVTKRISYRCPNCKDEYKIPVYRCPNPDCGVEHKRLRPGLYGIFRRKCICGTVIPLSVKARGYIREKSDTKYKYTKKRIRLKDVPAKCPSCGMGFNAGISKPTSIALIGGASAGKTTFKVAFSYCFLDEEAIKMGIDYDFPDEQSENEYNHSIKYFKGADIIPSTNRGMNYDISTFSFCLKNKKFDAERMIHIYDMPGEVFESGDAKEGWQNYRFSEGIVFLIDPYSMPQVRNQHENIIKGSTMGVCEMHMDVLVDSLINTLNNEKVKRVKNKFKIPVALTLNKVDSPLLKKMCGTEAVNALMTAVPEIFNDYFFTVDYICRCFISRNGGDGFIANLDVNFETVHFFFSSPMGYIPSSSRLRFSPVNVLPIMQWLMLRADTQLQRVWKPEVPVKDLTEEQKQMYKEHSEYYEKYVLPLTEEAENLVQ